MHKQTPSRPQASKRSTSRNTSFNLRRKQLASKLQKKPFATSNSPSPLVASSPEQFTLLYEQEDKDDSFLLQTVPILSHTPFIPPDQLTSTTSIFTKSNSDRTTSFLNPKTTRAGPIPRTVSRHKYNNGKAGLLHTQFIQHASPHCEGFTDKQLQHASFIVPDSHIQRIHQYNEVSPFISPTYLNSVPVSKDLLAHDTKAIDQLTTTTSHQTSPSQQQLQDLTVKPHDQLDSSYLLPILRVGPVPYALLQVRYSSPRTPHLRFLGGSRDELYLNQGGGYNTQKRQKDDQLDPITPLPSLFIASTLASEQTQGLFSKLLYNLGRPHYRRYSEQELHTLASQNPEILFDNAGDLINKVDEKNRPFFLHYRYNRGHNQFHSVINTRPQLPGDKRIRPYSKSVRKTIGRVIATQICQSVTPDQHNYDFLRSVDKWNVENHRDALIKDIKSKNLSAIHLIDLGHIQANSRDSLDPVATPISNNIVFPHIFNDVKTLPDFRSLAIYMTQSGTLGGKITSQLTSRFLSEHYQGTTSKPDIKQHLSPYSPGLHPLVCSINAIFEAVRLGQADTQEQLDSEKQIIDLLYKHFHLDATAPIRRLWEQVKQLNDSDPEFLFWIMPLVYYLARPATPHPSNRFPFEKYFNASIFLQPPTDYQASSLQWVPLQELMRNDPILAPRFAQYADTKTRLLTEHFNQQELFDHVKSQYDELRPDLAAAQQRWSRYYKGLPPADRSALAKVSVYFDKEGSYGFGGFGDAHCTEAGQIMTTSTGQQFPIRATHHDLLQTAAMKEYLKAIITKTRQESYQIIDDLDAAKGKKPFAERIQKRIQKYPAIANLFAYSMAETAQILHGDAKPPPQSNKPATKH